MNNLIIVGNGFDLAHNLRTSYKNFIDYIIQSHIDDNEKFADLINMRTSHINNLGSFYSAIKSPVITSKIKFNNEFFKSLVQDIALKNWCDIEKKYFTNLMSYQKPIDSFHGEFEIIRKYLIEYLKTIKTNTNLLESYTHLFTRLNKSSLQVVNFNYTNTLNNYVDDSPNNFYLKTVK